MGFLDDLKKNLGFGPKNGPHSGPEPATGLDASTSGGTPAPAPAASTAAQASPESAETPDRPVSDTTETQQAPEIPQAGPVPTAAPAPADQLTGVSEVVVEAGETLAGIAVQFGVDLDELIAVNADTVPNPELIYPGQVIRLP